MAYRNPLPVGTTLAPDRRRLIMAVQVLCGLAIGAALAGSGQYVMKQRAQHRLEDPLRLEGSRWKGSMGSRYPFTLRIDSVREGAVEGTMDWPGWGTTRVQGTLRGNVLELVDYAVVSGNVPIGDKKRLVVDGSVLDGTDKDGSVAMHATRNPL